MANTGDLRKIVYKTIEDSQTGLTASQLKLVEFESSPFALSIYISLTTAEVSNNDYNFVLDIDSNGKYSVSGISRTNEKFGFLVSGNSVFLSVTGTTIASATVRKEIKFGSIAEAAVSVVTGQSGFTNLKMNAGTTLQDLYVVGNSALLGTLDVDGNTTLDDVEVSGVANITNTTASTSSTTGALKVAGGAGVAGSLYVGTSIFENNKRVLTEIADNTLATGEAITDVSTSNNELVITRDEFVHVGTSETNVNQTIYGEKTWKETATFDATVDINASLDHDGVFTTTTTNAEISTASGEVDITSTLIDINGSLDHDGVFNSATENAVISTASGEIDLTSTLVDINGSLDHDGVFTTTTTNAEISTASGEVDITSTLIDINGSLDHDGVFNSATTNAVISTASGEIDLTSTLVDINGSLEVDGSTVSIDATSVANFTLTKDADDESLLTIKSVNSNAGENASSRILIESETIDINGDADISGNLLVGGNLTVTGKVTTNNVETVSTSNGVVFEGSAADESELTLKAGDLTADRVVLLKDKDGTIALVEDKLSVFADTTASELRAKIKDGANADTTGTGLLVFNNAPTLIGDVKLKNSLNNSEPTEFLKIDLLEPSANSNSANNRYFDLAADTLKSWNGTAYIDVIVANYTSSEEPTSPSDDEYWFNTIDKKLYQYDSGTSAWVQETFSNDYSGPLSTIKFPYQKLTVSDLELAAGGKLEYSGTVTYDNIYIEGTGIPLVIAPNNVNVFSVDDEGNILLEGDSSSNIVRNISAVNTGAGNATLEIESGSLSLDASLSSNFNVSGNLGSTTDVIIGAANAGSGDAKVLVTAKTEIDLTSTLIDINGSLDHDGVFTTTTTNAEISTASGEVDLTATTIDINGSLDHDGVFNSATENAVISTASGEIDLTSTLIDINGNLTVDGTDIDLTGAVDISGDLDVDNININGNTISSTNTNGNIVIDPNGTGIIDINGPIDHDGTFVTTTTNAEISTASGEVDLTATTIDINGTVDIDGSTTIDGVNISLDSLQNSNFSVSAIDGDENNRTLTLSASHADAERSASVLISAKTEIDLTAPTIDINGALTADTTNSSFAVSSGEIDLTATTIDINGVLDVDTTNAALTVTSGEVDLTATTIDINGILDHDGLFSSATTNAEISTASGEVDLTATNIDINGTVDIDGSTTIDGATVSIDATSVANLTLTKDADNESLLTIKSTNTNAGESASARVLVEADDEIELTATLIDINGNADVSGNLTIGGDLNVSGSLNYVSTEIIQLTDNFILLNSNFTGDPETVVEDAGIEVERGTGTNSKFFWDESADLWRTDEGVDFNSNLYVDGGEISLDATSLANLNVGGNSTSATDLTIGAANSGTGGANVLVSAKTEIDLTATTIDINGNLTVDGTDIDLTGAVDISGDLDVDNININGNTISSNNTDGNIVIDPNGAGIIDINGPIDHDGTFVSTTTNAEISTASGEIDLTSTLIDINGNLTVDGTDIDLTGAVDISGDLDVDNININGNTISSTNTDGNVVITPNGSGILDINGPVDHDGTFVSTTTNAEISTASGEVDLTATTIDINGILDHDGVFNSATENAVISTASGEIDLTATTIDINGNLTVDGTDIDLTGAVDISGDLDIDNININGNTISSTNTNGNIVIDPNGDGIIDINGPIDHDGTFVSTTTNAEISTASGEVDLTATTIDINGILDHDGVFNSATTNAVISTASGEIDLTATTIDINGTLDVDTTNAALTVSSGEIDLTATLIDINGSTTINGTDIDLTGAVDISGDLDVDNININGNTISTSTGDLILDPNGGDIIIATGDRLTVGNSTAQTGYTLYVNGNQYVNGNIYFPSDERLKNKIEVVSGSVLDSVLATDIWKFAYKARPEEVELGLMAQELERNFPGLAQQLVSSSETEEFEDQKALKESKLVYVLWAALQEESKKRKELEDKINKIIEKLGE